MSLLQERKWVLRDIKFVQEDFADYLRVGTKEYRGLAWWWGSQDEMKHFLRDCTQKERKAEHNLRLKNGTLRIPSKADIIWHRKKLNDNLRIYQKRLHSIYRQIRKNNSLPKVTASQKETIKKLVQKLNRSVRGMMVTINGLPMRNGSWANEHYTFKLGEGNIFMLIGHQDGCDSWVEYESKNFGRFVENCKELFQISENA